MTIVPRFFNLVDNDIIDIDNNNNIMFPFLPQHNITGGLPLSNAVASVLEDSVLESVDSTVSNIKSAMKHKRKEKENRTPSVNKKKSTRKGTTGSKGAVSLATPKHPAPRQAKTPMITPKFDTGRVMRSVSRAAKAGEVLVSLSGFVLKWIK